jgi:ubiquinone biosynthesis protein
VTGTTDADLGAAPAGEDIRRVAVATDRREGGDRAVQFAARLAAAHRAELVAIQIVPVEDEFAEPEVEQLRGELLESLDAVHATCRALVRTATPDAVADAIVACASELGADLLVVGNAGMRGRKELLLGNVANRVTHLARCSVVIAHSSPVDDAAAGSGAGAAAGIGSGLGERAQQIARVLGPVVLEQLGSRVMRLPVDAEGPRRLRLALEQLGPTFGKLGQVLSTRPDLLPREYLEELALLQSHVERVPEADLVTMMERELGVPWEDVFGSIEPEPLGAGTIAQVHRATLADGREVVVKVQRPSAAHLVDQDLRLLEKVVAAVGRSRRVNRLVDLPSVVDQLGVALRAELDCRQEARNLQQFAELLAPYPNLGVPGCHLELCTERLLVMDAVEGVPVTEAPEGPQRSAAARQLLQSYYQQILEDGFFHADPRPGNLLWADGCIWLLDLGMVGRLDVETRRHLTILLLAFAQGDVGLLSDVSLVLGQGDLSTLDIDAYQADLAAVAEGVRSHSLEELRLVDLLNDLTEISIRHGVPLPASLVMVGKALGQVQLTVAELEPGIDPIDEAGRFFVRSITGRAAGSLDPKELVYAFEKVRFRLDQIGEGLAMVTGGRPGRQLEVRFTSQRMEQSVARAGRTVGLGLSAGLAWVAATMAAGSPHVSPRVTKGLQGLATALSAGLAASLADRR